MLYEKETSNEGITQMTCKDISCKNESTVQSEGDNPHALIMKWIFGVSISNHGRDFKIEQIG